MSVQFLRPDDSDGDSWLEILEGSPGPSLQASPSLVAISRTASMRSNLDLYGGSPSCDGAPGPEQALSGGDAETSSDDRNHHQQSSAYDNLPEHHITPPIDIIHSTLSQQVNPFPSSFVQASPPSLDHPEIGDIVGHYHVVYNKLLTTDPDKTDYVYYKDWFLWLYRMNWDEIQALILDAPVCVVHATNHLFGLRNHPFWLGVKSEWARRNEWYAMYAACSHVLSWWTDSSRADDGSLNPNPVNMAGQVDGTIRNGTSEVDGLGEIEKYYYASHLEEEEEVFGLSSSAVLCHSTDAISLPGSPQQVMDYVKWKYQSFNGPEESTDLMFPILRVLVKDVDVRQVLEESLPTVIK